MTETENIITDWLHDCAAQGLAQNTLAAYRIGMEAFAEWLHARDSAIEAVTPRDVQQFKMALAGEYSPQTVNLRLSALRSFCRWAVRVGYLDSNPTTKVRSAAQPRRFERSRELLADDEVLALFATCDDTPAGIRDRSILVLMACCALRPSEIQQANIRDLKTRDDRLTLDIRVRGQIMEGVFAVIPRKQERAMRDWLERRLAFTDSAPDAPLFVGLGGRNIGRRLSVRSIRRAVESRFEGAGLLGDAKSTDSLRLTAIDKVAMKGTAVHVESLTGRQTSAGPTVAEQLENPAEDIISYGNR